MSLIILGGLMALISMIPLAGNWQGLAFSNGISKVMLATGFVIMLVGIVRRHEENTHY